MVLNTAAWSQKKSPKRQVQDTSSISVIGPPGSKYVALVIGNNEYKYVPKLQTAVQDANSVAQMLSDHFGFTTKVILNGTRNSILTALNDYRRSLPEDSNLLIYYAGHGHHDPDTDKAYWLPIDAQPDNNENWISADDITSDVKAIPSQHVLIIADSCYSGVLSRAAEIDMTSQERGTYLTKMMQSKSRNLMSSGSDEPVADGGAPGHSIFASAILESFQRIDQDQFTAADIFHRFIQPGVAGRSDQTPQYTLLKNSGHAFGDFVFSRVSGLATTGTGNTPASRVPSTSTTTASTNSGPTSFTGTVNGSSSYSPASATNAGLTNSGPSSTPPASKQSFSPNLGQQMPSVPIDTSPSQPFAVAHYAAAGVDFSLFCVGIMTVESGVIHFRPVQGTDGMHSFDFPVASVKEVKKNALVGVNNQAFHIRLTTGEVYNFSVVDPNTRTFLNADSLLLVIRTRLRK